MLPIDLRLTARRYGYKATLPPVDRHLGVTERRQLSRIEGEQGYIAAFSPHELAVHCKSPMVFAKALEVRDVRPIESAGGELRASFPPERLPAVARVLGL